MRAVCHGTNPPLLGMMCCEGGFDRGHAIAYNREWMNRLYEGPISQ